MTTRIIQLDSQIVENRNWLIAIVVDKWLSIVYYTVNVLI